MTPPNVITGAYLEANEQPLETLVAPIRTASGEVRVNVTIQDLE
jgi:CheY-specific phosphatase CheX